MMSIFFEATVQSKIKLMKVGSSGSLLRAGPLPKL